MLVGPDGRRFTDEGLGGVCQANAIARLARSAERAPHHGRGDVAGRAQAHHHGCGQSGHGRRPAASSLARPISTRWRRASVCRARRLQETVRAHNEAVAANDFARLAVSRSIKKHRPMTFAAPPFHAVPLCAGVTGTMGGVVIDEHARALRPDGGVFPGLYAVGTPVAGLEGGPRAGYVGGLVEGVHPRTAGG